MILLQLVTLENEVIVLVRGSGLSNLEALGIQIAKFLSIEFINTNPLYDPIIWGGVDASESEIRHLENGM